MAASSDTEVTEETLSTSSTRRPGLSFCLDFFLISVRSMMKLVQINGDHYHCNITVVLKDRKIDKKTYLLT